MGFFFLFLNLPGKAASSAVSELLQLLYRKAGSPSWVDRALPSALHPLGMPSAGDLSPPVPVGQTGDGDLLSLLHR